MLSLHILLLVVAVILAALAACGAAHPRFNLLAAAVALIALSFIF